MPSTVPRPSSLRPTPTSIHTITGGLADDALDGAPRSDLIRGDGASLTGGQHGGDDTISAGAGNDTVMGDAPQIGDALPGNDRIAGDAGNDLLYGDGILAALPITIGPAFILPSFALMGSDTIRGGEGNDTIYGDVRASTFGVIFGNDLLLGGAGDDVIHGESDGVRLVVDPPPINGPTLASGTASPPLILRNSMDTLDGGAGNDSLFGDGGHDVLDGGAGRDQLTGGTGDDTLRGGAGEDRFLFHAGDGEDLILDFASGQDRIVILGGPDPTTTPPAVHITAATTGLLITYGEDGDSVFLAGVTTIATIDIVFG